MLKICCLKLYYQRFSNKTRIHTLKPQLEQFAISLSNREPISILKEASTLLLDTKYNPQRTEEKPGRSKEHFCNYSIVYPLFMQQKMIIKLELDGNL